MLRAINGTGASDKQTRSFFRYYGQIEKSYYRALAAVNQMRRHRGDAKSLKTQTVAAGNGFVPQNEKEPPAPPPPPPVSPEIVPPNEPDSGQTLTRPNPGSYT